MLSTAGFIAFERRVWALFDQRETRRQAAAYLSQFPAVRRRLFYGHGLQHFQEVELVDRCLAATAETGANSFDPSGQFKCAHVVAHLSLLPIRARCDVPQTWPSAAALRTVGTIRER